MNQTQRDTYREMVRTECDEMRRAGAIFERQDISREDKIQLFNEAQVLIREYERTAQDYMDSILRHSLERNK